MNFVGDFNASCVSYRKSDAGEDEFCLGAPVPPLILVVIVEVTPGHGAAPAAPGVLAVLLGH